MIQSPNGPGVKAVDAAEYEAMVKDAARYNFYVKRVAKMVNITKEQFDKELDDAMLAEAESN